jgi:hypothetical protein
MNHSIPGLMLAAFSVTTATLQAADGDLDPTFNAALGWHGEPGWASIPVDPVGRTLRDSAKTITVLSDGSIIIGGLGGINPSQDNNGLLAAARLNPDGLPSQFFSSPENLNGGLTGRILWPYEFDFVTPFLAGYNQGGNSGVGFAGSGRVVTGTVFNHAKTFAIAPGGSTLNGGLGICEMIVGGALRHFYALGAATYTPDTAFITGYVRRLGDQAYLQSNCKLAGNQRKTVSFSASLPSSPPGLIGEAGVAPQFSRQDESDSISASKRLLRNFNSPGDNDALVCGTSHDARPPASSRVGCELAQPNLGGHLEDFLFSTIRFNVIPGLASNFAEKVVGLIESQIESAPAGSGWEDRYVLTLVRPHFYIINEQGQTFEQRSALQRSLSFADATSPANTLSLQYPRGVVRYDGSPQAKLWVVMGLRQFPGPTVFKEIAVARINYDDLTLDTSFGNGNGWRRYSLGGAEVIPEAITLDRQSNLVIAGSRRFNPETDDWDWFVMRLLTNNPDPVTELLLDGFE